MSELPFAREIRAFDDAISANPMDWATRLIFADYLEERGFAREGFCQRWLGVNRKCPLYRPKPAVKKWAWFLDGDTASRIIADHAKLHRSVFVCLDRRKFFNLPGRLYYHRDDAEKALALALEEVNKVMMQR